MKQQQTPGTIWATHGAWHWRVKFPDEDVRRDIVLTFPFSGKRIPADVDQSVAESAAFRLWEQRTKKMRPDGTPIFTVNELCDKWIAHCQVYFRDADGNQTSSAIGAGQRVRPLRELFGRRPVEALTHPDILALRDHLIAKKYTRCTVNGYLATVRGMFAWALDEALISAQTKAELTQVRNLKAFRSPARESEPILAVPDDVIDKTCALLPNSLADLVRVNRYTGMRPGEAVLLRWSAIERTGDVWAFRPGKHKNAWRNQVRVVAIGPRAQAILLKYEGAEGFIFSPGRTLAEYAEAARAARQSKLRTDEDAKRLAARRERGVMPKRVGSKWEVCAYARAVARICEDNNIPHWSPNQLRHTCATVVRRRFGLAAAHAVIGHSNGMAITDRYSFEAAEDEVLREASPAMLALG